MTEDQKPWGWYVGRDEEVYTSGPETREDAVCIAREEYEGAHICEAYTAPVSLASMFDASRWLEECEGRAHDYMGEGDEALFDMSIEDIDALQVSVRAAIEKWQADRGLVFVPLLFTEARHHEYIPADAEAST